MRHILLCLFICGIAAGFCAADADRVVIQSGHSGPVTKLAATQNGDTIVSIGEDGTLRVWNRTSKELIRRMQIGALPLIELVLHPDLPRAAVIESDGISVYRLSVWDWEENRKLFTRNLEVMPLYLSFSPGGSFLAYSVADWESMTILDAATGSRPPYLKNGFGIVSAFKISSSENRILVYQPSGSIQYRDLRSSTLVQEYRTLENLKQLTFVSNNRYMIGIWKDTLVAIDLLSGGDVASIRLQNIESYSLDDSTDTLVCTIGPETEEETRSLRSFTFTGSAFRSRYSRYVLPDEAYSNSIEISRNLYTATNSGDMYVQQYSSGIPRLFSSNKLLQIDDFDATGSLILTSTSKIITLYADFLFQPRDRVSDSVIMHTQENPLNSHVTIHPLDDGTYVVMDTASGDGRYQLFSPVEGAIGMVNTPYSAPVISLDTKGQRMLSVDATGKVQIYDVESQSFDFESQIFGIETAVFANGSSIIAAGRRSQTLRTSKLLIDTTTGETVPFTDLSIETTRLAYDPVFHTLYTLSLEGTSTNPRTVLTSYSGSIFESGETLYTTPGWTSDASMSVNRGTLFFTSAGVNKALYALANRFMHVEGNDNIPVKVEVIDNWVIGLNRDNSLSLWDRATGELVLNFYLFDDLSWTAVTPSGGVISSAGSLNSYIKVFR